MAWVSAEHFQGVNVGFFAHRFQAGEVAMQMDVQKNALLYLENALCSGNSHKNCASFAGMPFFHSCLFSHSEKLRRYFTQ